MKFSRFIGTLASTIAVSIFAFLLVVGCDHAVAPHEPLVDIERKVQTVKRRPPAESAPPANPIWHEETILKGNAGPSKGSHGGPEKPGYAPKVSPAEADEAAATTVRTTVRPKAGTASGTAYHDATLASTPFVASSSFTKSALALKIDGLDVGKVVDLVEIEGWSGKKTFYFSKILRAGKRPLIIMYAQGPAGEWVPRLLYKSNSDGGWRSTPQYAGGIFSKGKYHYTQETKPVEQILLFLEAMEKIPGKVLNIGSDREVIALFTDLEKNTDPAKKAAYTFEKEVHPYDDGGRHLLREFQLCPPGDCFQQEWADDARKHGHIPYENLNDFIALFDHLTYPAGFIPDFTKNPLRTYIIDHTLLGFSLVGVYGALFDGHPVEWHIAFDREGRVWVERINFIGASVSSYGTYRTWIDSGLITNKPLDYRSQTKLLWKYRASQKPPEKDFPEAFDTTYDDITALLDHLKVIIEFRLLRHRSREEIKAALGK